jgi:hypothetical protein
LDIHWPDFQNFSDSHPTPRHKLQHDPIPRLHGSENDFIHQILFDNLPLLGRALAKHFPQHCRIAGVLDFGINRVLEEVEERFAAFISPSCHIARPAMNQKPGKSLHEEVQQQSIGFNSSKAPPSFEVPPNVEAKRTFHIPIRFS